MESFDPVTRQGLDISNLFGIELLLSAVLFAFIVGWLVLALVRFQARGADGAEPPQTHGNRRLEIAWTALPALLLLAIFVMVVQTMRSVEASAPAPIRVRVIGHQWWWEYQLPDLGVVTANELTLPVGAPVQLELESTDVIHSFYVPRFGWMRDAVPGKVNRMQVYIERDGTFQGVCTQFCGLQHAWMRTRVTAATRDQFDTWIQQQRQPAATTASQRGQQVFLQNTCVSCHAIRGLPATAEVGPNLTHVGSRTTLGAGVIDNTPDNMRAWLRDAPAIKPGVLMPAFRDMPTEDLQALAEFLESLR